MSGHAPGTSPSSPDRGGVAVTGTAEPALASPPPQPTSAPAPGAAAGPDVRASLRVAAAGELRRDAVRGATLADPGHERAAPAGAHPPARALLSGRTGPGVRPVQADGLAGPGQRRAGGPGPHRGTADRRGPALGP